MSKRVSEGGAGDTIYKVVVNREGKYSIWPADRERTGGWKDAGKRGTKMECEKFVEKAERDGAGKRA
ncbi:MAG TPA: MbtH family NRPS accessory protein [Pyrinomonadaceae bacterium]|jgi:MbtH protein